MIVRATTFERWMSANFSTQELRDIASHGADSGWGGLTWYQDTVKLYDRYEDEIWELLRQDADDFDAESVPAFIASFRCADRMDDARTFKNYLTWYAAEHYARALTERDDD